MPPTAPSLASISGEDRRARIAVLAGTTAFSLVVIGSTAVSVALPAIGDDLDSRVAGLQWISNAYTLLFGSLLLSMGALCDQRGARRLMLGGVAVFVAGALLSTIAPTLGLLVAGQVLLGVGAAALMPASLALISHAHPDHHKRARALGVLATWTAIAVGLGPVVAGLLVETFGWRAVFAMYVPVALGIGVLVSRYLGDTPRRPAHSLDLPGQVAAILALGGLTLGFIESGEHGWGAPLTVLPLALALVAGAAFVAIERRGRSPMLPPILFSSRTISVAIGAGALVNFSFYGLFFVLSLFLQDVHGLSPLETGLVFLAMPASAALTGLPASRHTAHHGPRLPATLGAALGSAGCALMSGIAFETSIPVIVIGMTLVGAGGGLSIPSLMTALISEAPRDLTGTAVAAFTAGRQTGGMMGVAILGAMISSGSVASGVHLAAAVAALAMAICMILIAVGIASKAPGETDVPVSLAP